MTDRNRGRMGHELRSAQQSFVYRTFERSGHTLITTQSYGRKRIADRLSAAARFITSMLGWTMTEARLRIKEIAAHCKTLLGDEDDDLLLERDDAEAEGDPEEMEKALIEDAEVNRSGIGTQRIRTAPGMVRREILRQGIFQPS
jgi:hypothetical protein